MPRYFFNLQTATELLAHPDGTILPDLDAARADALLSARELLAARVVNGDVFEIVGDSGAVEALVPLRAALRID